MSDLKVQRRSALPPVASQRPDDTYRADAQLARKLMLSEYASLLSRAAPLARDVQPVPIALNDAPFARARSVGQHPPIPQQEEKLRASQQAFRRAATLPASVPLPVPPQATKLARQASEKSAPKRATPPAPAPTQATSSVEGRYDGGTRVQSPSHITDADRGLFTFLGSKTIFRSDVFAAVKANFGRVEVAGDGNCGFYSLLAGLVVHAMDFSQSRSTIAARLRELGQDDGNVDRAYKRMTGELSYATPKEPGAMHRGRQALRELANELALRPEGRIDLRAGARQRIRESMLCPTGDGHRGIQSGAPDRKARSPRPPQR